ncbi:MAG: D-tyrosyl-tRNA(Tyr) deacylase [Candidatus Marinimicrobia bacterium]|nr:D-tyrosyl-tRNA(Tyr) deacylase [Candidatus Neomarinimicrobiota bacterium]
MIAVIQRCSHGNVTVNKSIVGEIGQGLVILLGVAENDQEQDGDYLVNKIMHLRIFSDNNDKMNLSLLDIGGSALVISQFTLCGDTRKGRRPSFTHAASPEKGKILYEYFMTKLSQGGIPVQSGKFGAMMDVSLMNDGPVTFVLDSTQK